MGAGPDVGVSEKREVLFWTGGKTCNINQEAKCPLCCLYCTTMIYFPLNVLISAVKCSITSKLVVPQNYKKKQKKQTQFSESKNLSITCVPSEPD